MDPRVRNIATAYVSTGAAKIIGAIVQLAVLPIAARALGAEAFGLLFAVAALASFPLIAMAGFSPAASVLMSRTNSDKAGDYFWSLLFWSAVAGIGFALMSAAILLRFDPLGLDHLAQSNVAAYLIPTFSLYVFLNYLASPVDGARAALQQSHISGYFAIVGSAATMLSVLAAAYFGVGIVWIFVAIYMLPVAVQGINLIMFSIAHRKLLDPPRFNKSVGPEIAQILAANVQAQGGMVLYVHGTVYLVSQIAGLSATAVIGALVRVAILVHSMTVSLFNPVLPTITKAVAAGDGQWVRLGLRNLFVIALSILAMQSAALTFGGEWISAHLLELPTDRGAIFFSALAAFLFCYSLTHLLFLARLSTFAGARKGTRVLVAAAFGLMMGYVASDDDVAVFLFIQALTMALLAMLPYARDLMRAANPRRFE